MLVFYCYVFGKSIESLVFYILSRFSRTIASSTQSSHPRPPISSTIRPSEFPPLIFLSWSNSSGGRRRMTCSEGWWNSSRKRGKSWFGETFPFPSSTSQRESCSGSPQNVDRDGPITSTLSFQKQTGPSKKTNCWSVWWVRGETSGLSLPSVSRGREMSTWSRIGIKLLRWRSTEKWRGWKKRMWTNFCSGWSADARKKMFYFWENRVWMNNGQVYYLSQKKNKLVKKRRNQVHRKGLAFNMDLG